MTDALIMVAFFFKIWQI